MATPGLVIPSFTVDPNEALAAVDVYTQNSSVVINSYQEQAVSLTGLFDKLLSINPQALLQNIALNLNIGSNLTAAAALLQKGNLSASLSLTGRALGLPSLANLSRAANIIRSNRAISLTALLGAAGAGVGGLPGVMLNRLAYDTARVNRAASSFSYLNNRSGLSGISAGLGMASGLSTAIAGLLGDLCADARANFGLGAGAAFGLQPNFGANSLYPLDSSCVNSAIGISQTVSTMTGGAYTSTVTNDGSYAGSIAGLTYAGHQMGMSNIFPAFAASGASPRVLQAAALPLVQQAATSGDVELFQQIANTQLGKNLTSMVPEVTRGIVVNAKPPSTLAEQDYARYYDGFKSSLNNVSPDWQTCKRSGGDVVDASAVSQNPFMGDLLQARLNAGDTAKQSVYAGQGVATAATGASILPVDDEAYMLLGTVFSGDSVRSQLDTHFPYISTGINRDLSEIATTSSDW